MPRKPAEETPLYVKLPSSAVDKLDRASEKLGVAKKDLVAGLVTRYVDPDSQQGLTALGALTVPKPLIANATGPTMGTYSFQSYDLPDVLSVEQAAQFLQIEPPLVVELAEAGTLPGKKLGPVWRFAREALLAWLSAPQKDRR